MTSLKGPGNLPVTKYFKKRRLSLFGNIRTIRGSKYSGQITLLYSYLKKERRKQI